jgi:hypothetical protein
MKSFVCYLMMLVVFRFADKWRLHSRDRELNHATVRSKAMRSSEKRKSSQSPSDATTDGRQATTWDPRPISRFSIFEISLGHLRVCCHGASSLTRGRGCNLQLLLGLASAVPAFIFPRSRVVQLYPQALAFLKSSSNHP